MAEASNLLGYSVVQVGADLEEGAGGAPEELAEAEMGAAVEAGVVADGEFANAETAGDGDRGEEGLEEVDGEKTGNEFAAEDAELAAGVVERIAEETATNGVAQAGEGAAEERVVTLDTPAAGEVEGAGVDGGEELREIAGVVLAVAVHRENDFAAGGVEAVEERGGLAEILRMREGADGRETGGGGGNFGGRGVAAGVVDEDDFVRGGEGGEDGRGEFEEWEEVARFVVEGDDEGVAGRHRANF